MEQMLIEMSIYQLDRSTQNQYGDGRESRAARTGVLNLEFTRSQANGKDQLEVEAKIRGSTGIVYNPRIIYQNVKYQEADGAGIVAVKAIDGTMLYIDQYSIKAANVRLRCTCMDFYWRFATWNAKHRALDGNPPPPYVKKTDRPPVNPMQKPGVCKHIYKVVQQLRARGLM